MQAIVFCWIVIHNLTINKTTLIAILASLSTSCMVIKEYEKVYLYDDEMILSAKETERFETNFQIYREASSGANGAKSGGGCGCN